MKIKIVGAMTALNEEEWIEESLRRKLAYLDKVVIAEGAVVGHPGKLSDGCHSSDRTLEILKELEKEYSNLEVISINRKWKSKQEQQMSTLKKAKDGDWILLSSPDEFWPDSFRENIENLIRGFPIMKEFIFPVLNLVDGAKYALVDPKTHWVADNVRHHQHFFQFQKGMFYVNHPTINDSKNRDVFTHPDYAPYRKYIKYIPYNHYCYCAKIENQIRKRIYYFLRDGNKSMEKAIDIVRRKLDTVGYFYPNSGIQIKMLYRRTHPLQYRKFNDKYIPENIDWDAISEELSTFKEIPKK